MNILKTNKHHNNFNYLIKKILLKQFVVLFIIHSAHIDVVT